ncbi:fructokinase [Pontibacter ummariensis]|uniref:Fructokinase n=1 Tax=Pontibacter ummariensis TaxID=1610492 RepID=A0A239KKT3_9BACT|nr:carbohydrate kinase [Pontibacter ummariensis]PRY05708.1 fructokinase [Pontibacter ummariensis]SNT18213.1 fructokinase [Pontibacter ummariensis]
MANLTEKLIFSFGESLWDCLPDGRQPGGAPMNIALHLHRLGAPVRLISRIGEDALGQELADYLRQHSLHLDFLQTDPIHPTGTVAVTLAENGDAAYDIVQPVAWDFIAEEAALQAVEQNMIVYSSLASRNETSRNTLLHLLPRTSFRAFDLNLRPPFYDQELIETLGRKADLLKMNGEEFALLKAWYGAKDVSAEEALKKISTALENPMICVTAGSEGAWLLQEGQVYFQPAFKVQVKDTIGAGDAFLAALLKQLLESAPPQQCLQYACAVGAFVASKEGANPAYTPQDIDAMLR